MTYTISQTKLLEAFTNYRYLIPPHMMALGIQKNASALANKVISPLAKAEKPLIRHNKLIKSDPSKGKLHYIYCLTDEGARTIADYLKCDPQSIVYPKKDMRFASDYFHRCDYISFYIEFEKYLNQTDEQGADLNNYHIQESHHYFDRRRLFVNINGKRYNPTTLLYKIEREPLAIEPDGLFVLSNFEKQKLFSVEIHRSPNTKDILEQINQHLYVMSEASMSKRFKVKEQPQYLLSVSSKESTLKNILARVHVLPAICHFREYLLFSHIEKVKEDFENAWVDFRGEKVNIFNKL